MAIIYVAVLFTLLMGMVSFAVDYAHVQLAKTELQSATDASARFAAAGLKNILNGESAAVNNALVAARDNKVDGSPLILDPGNDVKMIVWNASNRTYTVTNNPGSANGVAVFGRRTRQRGNPIPLTFARLLGINSCDINATAIATVVAGESRTYTVNGTNNPFLAGMPSGSVASLNNPHNSPDYAGTSNNPRQSPTHVNIPITSGVAMTFDGINGGANNDHLGFVYDADGNPSDIQSNYSGNDNGFGNMTAPLNSLVGVFLDDRQPNQTNPPSGPLNFSTEEQRNFTSLEPKLKQIFFIGDGRNADGIVQQFVPPAGATRLYLGNWDGYEWNNNIGSFSVTVHLPGTVTLVQ